MISTLMKTGICFAIMKSYSYLTKAKYYQNIEYEVLALSKDFEYLESFGFEFNNDLKETPRSWFNPPGIISRTMNLNDISEFNNMKEEHFKEVFNSRDGVVYELKTKSLQEMFYEP
ncbi:hypothetical protein [Chryseobacterium profundimaris]|uniref:Uncharacterized protein n=1 Tax=Chryseobacterium profundimaris TaxID=1387275 RepID=A0ABY1NGA5_9FLAO|nr:hypothetical protein [Chryseobacterium profundimaris]SMP08932.1 hypothetical protein SAMN06264346_1029 [Chryseobacterium profundimaris]